MSNRNNPQHRKTAATHAQTDDSTRPTNKNKQTKHDQTTQQQHTHKNTSKHTHKETFKHEQKQRLDNE